MLKTFYIVELSEIELFISIMENNGGTFINYLNTSNGKVAIKFSVINPVAFFSIGFQFGAYSPHFISN